MSDSPDATQDLPIPVPDDAAIAGPSSGNADPNLLDDVEYILYQASTGKRFANMLIDTLVYYFVWKLFLAYWYVQFLVLIRFPLQNRGLLLFAAYAGALLFFGLVICGFEFATGGKTLGKYVTRTRAIMDDGTRITGKAALLRFLIREIPLEEFSAFGDPSYPWHDRWTKTVVIDEKLTTLPPED